jgi:hypothetical protein
MEVKNAKEPGAVVHPSNLSYSAGRDRKDHDLRLA